MADTPDNFSRALTLGCGVTFLSVFGALIAVSLLAALSPAVGAILGYAAAAIGLSQFVIVGPVWLRARRQGRSETAKGYLVAAGITLLLNASCWGVLLISLSKSYPR